jgi:hypothetical protein
VSANIGPAKSSNNILPPDEVSPQEYFFLAGDITNHFQTACTVIAITLHGLVAFNKLEPLWGDLEGGQECGVRLVTS